MARLFAYELRTKDVETLESEVVKMKEALVKARIDIQLKGNGQNLKSIREIRRNIARTLQVITQKQREAARKRISEEGMKVTDVPKYLRPKLTRAIRRRLTPEQANKKSIKVGKRITACRPRNYAVLA